MWKKNGRLWRPWNDRGKLFLDARLFSAQFELARTLDWFT